MRIATTQLFQSSTASSPVRSQTSSYLRPPVASTILAAVNVTSATFLPSIPESSNAGMAKNDSGMKYRSCLTMLHESARVIPNGCRSHSTMAIPSVSQLPPLMGGMLFVCSAPHLPHAVHRTTRRSSTDTGREPHYSARVLDFDSLALSMSSGHRPFHGHPLLFMGVRGRTEVRNLNRQWWAYCFSSSRLLSAGCRGGRASARWVLFAAGVCRGAAGYRVCGGGRYVRPTCCRYNSRSCRRRSGPSFASASCTTGSIILVSFANLGPYTSLARH